MCCSPALALLGARGAGALRRRRLRTSSSRLRARRRARRPSRASRPCARARRAASRDPRGRARASAARRRARASRSAHRATRSPPGASLSRCIASSLRSASLPSRSFLRLHAMAATYPAAIRLDTWSSGSSRSRAGASSAPRPRRPSARRPLARAALDCPGERCRSPARSGIDHVVVVMMENRSFDHMLGWLPGADGKQAGLSYPDAHGAPHATYPLAPDFQGCALRRSGPLYDGARVAVRTTARCDGWLRAGTNDLFPIGYYRAARSPVLRRRRAGLDDLRPLLRVDPRPDVPQPVLLALPGVPTASTTSFTRRPADDLGPARREAESAAATTAATSPFLLLWTSSYHAIITQHFARSSATADGASCRTSRYVDPNYTFDGDGPRPARRTTTIRTPTSAPASTSCQPIYNAVTTSPAWPRTLLDHHLRRVGRLLRPRAAAGRRRDVDAASTSSAGSASPCVLISPFARRGFVATRIYDHTSILSSSSGAGGSSRSRCATRDGEQLATRSTSRTATSKAPRDHRPPPSRRRRLPLGVVARPTPNITLPDISSRPTSYYIE